MRTEGNCDGCGQRGDWEIGFFENIDEAMRRPPEWACAVMAISGLPINVPAAWKGDSWPSTTFCEAHNTDVIMYCPKCFRKDGVSADGGIPPLMRLCLNPPTVVPLNSTRKHLGGVRENERSRHVT